VIENGFQKGGGDMSVEKTLFSILYQELSDNEDNSYALEAIDKETYLAVLNLAEKHDIAHIVASAYSKAGLLGKDDFSEKYRKKVMMAFYRSEQKKYVLSEVSRAFDDMRGGIYLKPELSRNTLMWSVPRCQRYSRQIWT